jgi:aspartyl-tRNA(Asn)/glutamyl-tRNA(Gln) amidotransferase subunit A
MDATALADAVRNGVASATEVVTAALEALARPTSAGAFWAVDDARALAAARRIDQALARRAHVGPLAGVPLAVKDCFNMAGLPTSSGLDGPHDVEVKDATAVARIRRAGSIPLGKTAMNRLGWSTESEPAGWPRCVNPRYPALGTGGSSSGSAAAVAAGVAGLGLGTDVAGSVRIPAAYCGIVGFKPARGTMPRGGMVPVAPSFDLAGVLARSVRDCALACEVISGKGMPKAEPAKTSTGWRVACLEDLFEAAEPEVSRRVMLTLAAAGSRVRLETARLNWKPDGFGRILAVELAQTWGNRIDQAPERFTEAIRASVAYGRRQDVNVYRQELSALARSRTAVARQLAAFDVVASPTVPHAAPEAASPESVAVATTFTRVFSALGWAALSIPCGTDPQGRPVAVQLAAHPARLNRLFEVGRLVEASARIRLGGVQEAENSLFSESA